MIYLVVKTAISVLLFLYGLGGMWAADREESVGRFGIFVVITALLFWWWL